MMKILQMLVLVLCVGWAPQAQDRPLDTNDPGLFWLWTEAQMGTERPGVKLRLWLGHRP